MNEYYPYSYKETKKKTFWGSKVYEAYCFKEFAGYRTKNTEKEKRSFIKKYNGGVIPKTWETVTEIDFK